jgi:hypothetical protein
VQPQLHDSSATATALYAPQGGNFCFRDSASSAACNSNNSLPRDDDNDAASAAGASAAPPATTAQLLPQHSLSDYTAVCCAFSFSSSDGTSFSFSGLQLAHLPQPRFQVLMQRHAICAYASACRQCNGILQPATPKQHASAIQYQRASAAAVFRQQRLCFSFSIQQRTCSSAAAPSVTRQHSLVDSHFGDSNVGHIGDGGSSLLQLQHSRALTSSTAAAFEQNSTTAQ